MCVSTSDKDVGRFNRWANSYDKSGLQGLIFAPLQESTLRVAAAAQPVPTSILDIGCGTGLLLRQAAQRFPSAQLTGIDAAQDMVLVARASVPEGLTVHFMHAFVEQLPFPDASFDLVMSTMSFHHWADQTRALCEVRRVLSSGGVFALADAFSTGWLRWLFARSNHGRFNKPEVVEEMLRSAGFSVECFSTVPRFGGTVQVVVCRASVQGEQRVMKVRPDGGTICCVG